MKDSSSFLFSLFSLLPFFLLFVFECILRVVRLRFMNEWQEGKRSKANTTCSHTIYTPSYRFIRTFNPFHIYNLN